MYRFARVFWCLAAIVPLEGGQVQESVPGQAQLSVLPPPAAGVPTFGTTVVLPSGLRGDIYPIPKHTWVLPDFQKLEPAGSIWTSRLDISPRHWKGGFPGVTKRFEWFAIDYSGRFWIEKPGLYRFALLSDDGSKLYIDNQVVVDNDCQHPPLARSGEVDLAGGIHSIRVSYFQGPRDCLALVLSVSGPDPEENWRIFSTEEFKPPPDVEAWKYSDPNALTVPVDPDAGRRKLSDTLKKPPRVAKAPPPGVVKVGSGCLVPDPTPVCHE